LAGYDGQVHVWDYDFSYSPGGQPPWPQYNHDARHTNLASSPAFVDVNEELPAPAKGVVELAAPWPNPARAKARLWYAIGSDRGGEDLDLSIYDLAGRHVRTLESGRASAGRHSADWNLRSDDGGRLGAGVYFVRLSLGATRESRKVVL